MRRSDYLPMTLEQLLKEVMRRFNNQLPTIHDVGPCFTAAFTIGADSYYANANSIRDVYTEILLENDRLQQARKTSKKKAA